MQVEVKVSEVLDKLIFVPRDNGEMALLKRLLFEANPGVKFRRSAEGIWVHAESASLINFESREFLFKWSELADRFIRNRTRIKQVAPSVVSEIKKIRHGDIATAKSYLKKVPGLEILDNHQVVNVACMTLPDGYGLCVFDEQGAGKTVTLIFAFDVLVERDKMDFALIIAPKSMVSEWPVDFAKFMPDQYKVTTLVGNYDEKIKALSTKSDVIVTNFETAVSMEDELRAVLRKHGSRAMIVVDESFFAKNLDAKRTQAIKRLREYCGRAFVLCGTPAPNSPTDIIEQFNIVDFGITFSGVSIPKEKQEAAALIKWVIEERGPFVRHLKADVLPDLPVKNFQKVLLPMQPGQCALYNEVLNDLVSDLRSTDDSGFERKKMAFLARRSALLQICSSPSAVKKSLTEVPCKLLALDAILADLIGKQGEKVIIWSFYTATLEALCARYKQYNPVRYDGTITDTVVRRESVRRFREDTDTMLFIANPAAAGAGLNLQSARYAIYESMSNQAAHYLQSLDRIHRRGQKNEVQYLILLCEHSIEISEYSRLLSKEQAAQEMLGDDAAPMITRDRMLHELTFLTPRQHSKIEIK